jgi:hypothetical protein
MYNLCLCECGFDDKLVPPLREQRYNNDQGAKFILYGFAPSLCFYLKNQTINDLRRC